MSFSEENRLSTPSALTAATLTNTFSITGETVAVNQAVTGATTINLPDTVGFSTPDELKDFFERYGVTLGIVAIVALEQAEAAVSDRGRRRARRS